MPPRYVPSLRELIKDPAVVEELDLLAAFLQGALAGFEPGAAEKDDSDINTIPEDDGSTPDLQLDTVSQTEAEAGAATTRRIWTAERVAQAIAALAAGTTKYAVTIANADASVAEGDTTVASFSVPAGTWLNGEVIYVRFPLVLINNSSGAGRTTGFKLDIAGVLTTAFVVSWANNATERKRSGVLELMRVGTTVYLRGGLTAAGSEITEPNWGVVGINGLMASTGSGDFVGDVSWTPDFDAAIDVEIVVNLAASGSSANYYFKPQTGVQAYKI